MSNKEIFVIMPFSTTSTCKKEDWDDIFLNVFTPAIENCNYSCERAKSQTGSLIKSIIKKLRNARIVIADITDQNPNVFYELGVRHSLSKRTIIVSQKPSDIPSDLRGYWSIIYGTKPGEVTEFKNEIKRIISDIEQNPEESDSPISDYLKSEGVGISDYVGRENIKKLGALFTELSANINTLNKVKENSDYRDYLNYDCLSFLLNTLYIDVGPDMLKDCYELRHNLTGIKNGHNINQSLLDLNINIGNRVLENILEIRNKIALGQYLEPIKVSTVIWEPATQLLNMPTKRQSEKLTAVNSAYSMLVKIDDKKIQDLKEHLKNKMNTPKKPLEK